MSSKVNESEISIEKYRADYFKNYYILYPLFQTEGMEKNGSDI